MNALILVTRLRIILKNRNYVQHETQTHVFAEQIRVLTNAHGETLAG